MKISYDFIQSRNSSFSHNLFAIVAIAWTISQCVDYANLWFNFGAYNSPALLSILALVLIKIKSHETNYVERVWGASRKIVDAIRSGGNLDTMLPQIAKNLSVDASYVRASVYVDRFTLGLHPEPSTKFERVYEHGYDKDTGEDKVVAFDESRGLRMQEALASKELRLQKGGDNQWFIVIPVGEHMCINLSVSDTSGDYGAYESFDLLKEVYPNLIELEAKFLEFCMKQRMTRHKVRTKKGLGSWNVTLGAIFVDIAGFSKSVEVYGDHYASFVGEDYFPAMIRRLSKYAVPEFTKGDEIYFVVIDEVIDSGQTVEQALREVIKIVAQFADYDGGLIAKEKGYEAPELRVGVNYGEAKLVCTEQEVKTLGGTVNLAKRLQESARRGEILIQTELVDILADDDFKVGEARKFLQKENLVEAAPLFFRYKKAA